MISHIPAKDVLLCGSGAKVFNETHDASYEIIHEEAVAPIELIVAMELGQVEVSPEPLYLRNADAKPQAGFVLPRA